MPSQQGWRRSVVWVSSEQPKRAAVAQLRQVSLVCASACAVEALPSSQTAEQPASREAAVQDEQLPRAVSATGFGGNTRTKKRIFEKRLRVRRVHPWATPPCKRLILGALRGSVGAIVQYFGNGGSTYLRDRVIPRDPARPGGRATTDGPAHSVRNQTVRKSINPEIII